MAVYAQTACTLSTITDVTAVYTYYYLASSTITSNMAPQDNVNPPDETHDAGSRIVVVTYDGNTYTWRDIDPSLSIVDNVITTAVGQLYYIECVKFSDGTYDWGPLMTSSTYAAAKAAYNLSSQALSQANTAAAATALLGGHFIYKSTTSVTGLTPPSANVVENIEATISGVVTDVTDKPAYWGYNTHIGANGIKLRHNETDLSSWTNSSLIFYDPSQGAKMMELSSSALKFFDVNDSTHPLMSLSGQALNFYQYGTNTAAATINNNGLNIVNGSITLGSNGGNFTVTNEGVLTAKSGTIGGWHLGNNYLSTSTTDGTPGSGIITLSQGIILPSPSSPGSDDSISDDGVLPYNTQLAFTVSNQFGVTADGTLYASGAQINGELSGQTIDDINDSLNTLGDTVTNQAISINKIQMICIEEAAKITGIVLSKGDYQLSITSDSLTFQNQGANIAYLSNQALSVPSAEMTSDLTLGPFKWIIGQNRLILMRV